MIVLWTIWIKNLVYGLFLKAYLELFLWPLNVPFGAILWAYYMSHLAMRIKGIII